MAVKFYSPVIFVNEIERSKKFYTEILDEEIEHDFGSNILFISHLSLWKIMPGHEIAEIADKTRKRISFELYFETEDIHKSAEKLKANNIRLLHDIKTESWGQKTIRFYDPDDHLLEIGESFNTFISRIYEETGSIDETAVKTGVHKEIIRKIVS